MKRLSAKELRACAKGGHWCGSENRPSMATELLERRLQLRAVCKAIGGLWPAGDALALASSIDKIVNGKSALTRARERQGKKESKRSLRSWSYFSGSSDSLGDAAMTTNSPTASLRALLEKANSGRMDFEIKDGKFSGEIAATITIDVNSADKLLRVVEAAERMLELAEKYEITSSVDMPGTLDDAYKLHEWRLSYKATVEAVRAWQQERTQ